MKDQAISFTSVTLRDNSHAVKKNVSKMSDTYMSQMNDDGQERCYMYICMWLFM